MARISSFKCVQNKREKGIVHIIKRKNEIEEKREEHVVSAIKVFRPGPFIEP